jgi:hypothetical protein
MEVARTAVYTGRVISKTWSLDVPGDFEPLVLEELFNQAQRAMVARVTPLRLLNVETFPNAPRLLAFARSVLLNLKAVYVAAKPAERRELTAALFESVTLNAGKVRTRPRGRLLKQLTAFSESDSHVASPTGSKPFSVAAGDWPSFVVGSVGRAA